MAWLWLGFSCFLLLLLFFFLFFSSFFCPFCAREGEKEREKGGKRERKRERERERCGGGGGTRAPLSCKFKCGRDVPTNLNVKRLDGHSGRHRKHGQGESGGRGGGSGSSAPRHWPLALRGLDMSEGAGGARRRTSQWPGRGRGGPRAREGGGGYPPRRRRRERRKRRRRRRRARA